MILLMIQDDDLSKSTTLSRKSPEDKSYVKIEQKYNKMDEI